VWEWEGEHLCGSMSDEEEVPVVVGVESNSRIAAVAPSAAPSVPLQLLCFFFSVTRSASKSPAGEPPSGALRRAPQESPPLSKRVVFASVKVTISWAYAVAN
jgi:hypothetical protein